MMLGRAHELLLAVVVMLGFSKRKAQAFSCSSLKKSSNSFRQTSSHWNNQRSSYHPSTPLADSRRFNQLLSFKEGLHDEKEPIRSRLRQITGFSLTAFRATMRTATGISMTAVYASTLAFTGQWIRQTMKVILSILPAWARYFVQPILILYYLPLCTLRNLTGPNRRRGLEKPHALVDGWNEAVVTADNEASALWEIDDQEEM